MVGRKEETKALLRALSRNESQFIAVYGRRRVGKTYLVRKAFGNEFAFYHTGIFDGSFREQLDEFRESMKGIYSTSVGTGTIDESPMAYKDPKEILRLIEDTVEVEYFIRPVINMKATNAFDSSIELDMNEEQD